METNLIQSKQNSPKKQMGQFRNLDEAVQYKTGLVNKMLAKIDKTQLEKLTR